MHATKCYRFIFQQCYKHNNSEFVTDTFDVNEYIYNDYELDYYL